MYAWHLANCVCENQFLNYAPTWASSLSHLNPWTSKVKTRSRRCLRPRGFYAILLNAFFSFCEPLQYFVGFVILVHIKILCIFQYFYLILWNFHCVFKLNSRLPSPCGKRIFLGRVQRFDFTGSCVFCTTVVTQQESYPCLFLCCASTQNFVSTV